MVDLSSFPCKRANESDNVNNQKKEKMSFSKKSKEKNIFFKQTKETKIITRFQWKYTSATTHFQLLIASCKVKSSMSRKPSAFL